MAAAQTRDRILRATVTTLATQGFARTTARAIAATGGFAPGVIYYHHADLDDLFIATARFVSDARLSRYRSETAGVTGAAELMHRLRRLYDEDVAEGHIAAVQELVAAAAAVPRLAEQVKLEVARWHEFAEGVLRSLLAGTPLAELLPLPELAAAAVAMYLGLEMLSHLHADQYGPDAMFRAGLQIAAFLPGEPEPGFGGGDNGPEPQPGEPEPGFGGGDNGPEPQPGEPEPGFGGGDNG